MASDHPADILIRALVATGRPATPDDIAAIIARMATAPFDWREVAVLPAHRPLAVDGRPLGGRADSLRYHLARRIVLDGQWAENTSTEDYLRDLRAATLVPGSRLAVYSRRGGVIAAALADTEAAVPPERMGPAALPLLLVVYSADRSAIITGYQCSSLHATAIPMEARWLK